MLGECRVVILNCNPEGWTGWGGCMYSTLLATVVVVVTIGYSIDACETSVEIVRLVFD